MAGNAADRIVKAEVGSPIRAADQDIRDDAIRAACRNSASAGFFSSAGSVVRGVVADDEVEWRWAKLAFGESIENGGTANFNLWVSEEGGYDGWEVESNPVETLENVYASPTWPSGISISDEDGRIFLITQIIGRWVAILPQPTSEDGDTTTIDVVTGFRVENATQTLEQRTTSITVHSKEDPDDWDVIHTGTVCP